MDIIKTRYKSKIPKSFSYPVGAEILSNHFAGVAQYSDLELSFDDRGEYWASRFQNTLKKQGDILILRVEYENNRPGFSASKSLESWYGEHWKIRVYAVPREVKHIIKSTLIEKYLPKAKIWLNEKYITKEADYSKFDVLFNLGTQSFNILENEKR